MNRPFAYFLISFLFALNSCGINRSLNDRPDLVGIENIDTLRVKHNDSLYTIGNNSLSKNEFGIWELYVEGNPLERGMVTGSLTRELMHKQEDAVMNKIASLVPSSGYQNFLKKVVTFFNRKMHLHVAEEYKAEIYGVSRFANTRYDDFAPAYVRSLYLHGAHDIGHALQDLMLVGCTSFAAWDDKTSNGNLLLGRNFDFYLGDSFAEDKIAAFINPDEGYKFMTYTWGGMIGVVSGMNEKGISVTLNAGKSSIPLLAKTPVSLVAREILQYAASTGEAIAIAQKREVFVSEAIMVGSAAENKAIVIEVAPKKFGVYEVSNSNQLVCSNHFQSDAFTDDRRNLKTIEQSHTAYRFNRMEELLRDSETLTPVKAVGILRNTQGMGNSNIGLGNEKSINQLLAHHGIIFQPVESRVWVSANPYQLGAFVAYDINDTFERFEAKNKVQSMVNLAETIPEDDFIQSTAFTNYKEFRNLIEDVKDASVSGGYVSKSEIDRLIQLNPHYWKAWATAGEYYYSQQDYKNAVIHFKQALKREVTTLPDTKWIENMIIKSYKKI